LEAGIVAALALSLFDMDLRTPGVLAGLLLSLGAMEKLPARSGTRWAWRLMAAFLLLSAFGLWCARAQRRHADAFSAGLGACLQPLDAELQAQRVGRGEEAWPWAAWAGRRQASWLSAQAHIAGELRGDAVAALAAEQRAALARPYWAPGWFKLAERQSVAGRPEAEVGESISRALALEPNFARALAWRCDQALAQGRVKEAQAIYRLIQHIQTLRYSQEEPDAYSLFIQSIPPEWLASRNKSLHLSTTFRPKS
jgi:hypothetical protein